jgi:hypothetical protein
MHHRTIDSFVHQLRAGRDQLPRHDDVRDLYEQAIERMGRLADGLYKRQRLQVDENLV